MNSPVQLAEKLEEFEDVKRTPKQKSSNPFVKKQEFKSMEKTRRYEAPRKFEYNRTDKKFPASTNFNKHYEAPVTKYENVQIYQDNAQKGYYNKNYEKHPNHNATKRAQANYSKSQKFRERPKETCTLVVKEGLRTKEIFFGKKKIIALIDSGSSPVGPFTPLKIQVDGNPFQEYHLRQILTTQYQRQRFRSPEKYFQFFHQSLNYLEP
ncbi:uncharacterized protein TNCT_505391 [Trichonephila clavata]|uniref:Uncharacterized protein n=1 Tax=Trichonephila clavata TaxID=2740835 RepID=A0A8X6GIL3_TRICU|nr:uncharacterized protein TNCT_505391 [Trichonephila clavata]